MGTVVFRVPTPVFNATTMFNILSQSYVVVEAVGFVEFQEFFRHKHVHRVYIIDVNIIHTLFSAC